jgi:aspartate carbamoyltransferase catalytic subunit
MHPGPINRGLEIDARSADSPQSRIVQQVSHGVLIRMAILYLLGGANK